MPLWSNQLVKSSMPDTVKRDLTPAVVYYPTCISRVMGGSVSGNKTIVETFISVSEKTGVGFIIPDNIQQTCCGQIYSSKGFKNAYEFTVNQTISELWKWTKEGQLPIVLDITSCTQTLQNCGPSLTTENRKKFESMTIIDSVDFIADFLLPKVKVARKKNKVVLHPVCSLQKMGLESKFKKIASAFAHEVVIPYQAGCCGMAGDRGFIFPELTASATKDEANEVKRNEYDGYYSSGKTCEIALSEAVGHNYESIIYLLDECI